VDDPKSCENNSKNTPLSPVSQKSKSNNPNKGPEIANSSLGGDKVKFLLDLKIQNIMNF